MKEATGELNMTVITVVAIAAVAAFFYAFVWPAIRNTLQNTTLCNSADCGDCVGKGCKCTYVDGDQTKEVTCNVKDYSGTGGGNNGGNNGGNTGGNGGI